MLITRPVGDIFVYQVPDAPMDVWLKVLKSDEIDSCNGCVFANSGFDTCIARKFRLLGHCSVVNRTDGNDVIFKQIGTYKPQKGVENGD